LILPVHWNKIPAIYADFLQEERSMNLDGRDPHGLFVSPSLRGIVDETVHSVELLEAGVP
jgi:hypothetical protein